MIGRDPRNVALILVRDPCRLTVGESVAVESWACFESNRNALKSRQPNALVRLHPSVVSLLLRTF